MSTVTPGEANAGGVTDLGPLFGDVTDESPAVVLPGDVEIMVTAEVEASEAPVAGVTLYHRIMFGAESGAAMADDGVSPDLVAGDDVFSGVVPLAGLQAGEMVRWRLEAEDVDAAD